jgi:hypothetical protein
MLTLLKPLSLTTLLLNPKQIFLPKKQKVNAKKRVCNTHTFLSLLMLHQSQAV